MEVPPEVPPGPNPWDTDVEDDEEHWIQFSCGAKLFSHKFVIY